MFYSLLWVDLTLENSEQVDDALIDNRCLGVIWGGFYQTKSETYCQRGLFLPREGTSFYRTVL